MTLPSGNKQIEGERKIESGEREREREGERESRRGRERERKKTTVLMLISGALLHKQY